MSEQIEIILKQFENPSLFYFVFDGKSTEDKSKKKEIHLEISKHVIKKEQNCQFIPEANTLVGYFYISWTRWVRAKVISKPSNGDFKVFLIDYGHDVIADSKSVFTDLPESLRQWPAIVKRGSLGLQPTNKGQERNGRNFVQPCKVWSEKATELFRQLEYERRHETKKFFLLPYRSAMDEDGTYTGDVVLKTSTETISISERLIKEGWGVREEGLVRKVPKSSNSEPIANFEKIFETFFGKVDGVRKEEVQKLDINTQVKLAAEDNTNSNKNQEKTISQHDNSHKIKSSQGVLLTPSPLRSSPSNEPKTQKITNPGTSAKISIPSTLPATDILVYGESLLPKLKSVEDAQYFNSIEIKSKELPMTKVQSYCWPQISDGRSMVIIGDKESMSEERLYTAPIVNSLTGEYKDGLGPVAIMVAKTLAEVETLAKVCSQMVEKLRVVTASGPVDKKFELMNGCDLLVTTPAAFSRLIDGVTPSFIFDIKRIRHLVFQRIDTMLQPFESEINSIIRTCTSGREKTENNPQIIVTSSRWMKDIKSKLMSLMKAEHMVVCVEDFMEAAAFVGCDVFLQSVLNIDDKNNKLRRILDKGDFKTRRTLVVTNDEKTASDLIDFFNEKADEIFFLSADEKNYNQIKLQWKQQCSGSYSILVLSDRVLDMMELRNVENIIHFTLPSQWERFSQRHSVLLDNFYASLRKESSRKASIAIYLDDECADEFSVITTFLLSRQMANIPASVIDNIEKLKSAGEMIKCDRNIPICNKIWYLAECFKSGCPSRHIFTETDKPLRNIPVKTTIKFEIVFTQRATLKSFFSPTSYIIKINSQMIVSDWCSWQERNELIEKFLDEDLQAFFNEEENQKRADPKFGDIYAVKSDKKWRRCKVMEINQIALSPVYLIDTGDDIRCDLKNLFELPEDFKKIDPLVYKLQIMNLVPFDKEDNWSQSLKEFQRRQLQESTAGCIFTSKVQMAIQDILFTEAIDAKEDETGNVKLRLDKELLKTHICTLDENVSKKLRKLAVEGKLMQLKQESKPEIKPERIDIFDDALLLESWKSLSCKSYYDVIVKDFKNPESFFIVLDANDKKYQKVVMKEIENSADRIPLKVMDVGAVCAVVAEKTYRGKILKIDGDVVQVLRVDFGEIVDCKQSQLFELPKDLLTKLTFQTIHCRLVGVRPKYNMDIWPRKQSEAVGKVIKSCQQPLKLYVEKMREEKSEDLKILGVHSYDVILIDSKNGLLIADVVVNNGFADSVDYNKPSDLEELLDSGNASADEGIEGCNDMEILRKLLELQLLGDENEDEDYVENTQHTQEADKEMIEETTEQPEESTKKVTSSLSYINKHMNIEWRQDDTLIYLMISAIDCQNYGLKIEGSSITIVVSYVSHLEKESIELYSGIDPKLSSHELRGIKIIVRLVKKTLYNQWPRLTQNELTKERKQFIQASVEKISFESEKEAFKEEPQQASKYLNCFPDGFEDYYDQENVILSDDDDNDDDLF